MLITRLVGIRLVVLENVILDMFRKVIWDDDKRRKVMFVFLYKREDGFVLILMSSDIEYLMIIFIEKFRFLVIDDIVSISKIFLKNDGVFF